MTVAESVHRHRVTNRLHTFLIVTAILALAALLGWAAAGMTGLAWGAGLGIGGLVFGGRISPRMVMAMYRGRLLRPREAPDLYAIVEELARRANLESVPRLYYVASGVMNAFAVGTEDDAAIGLTDGILRGLTLRELVAVLAHEVSHVASGDLRVMMIADVASRITGLFSTFGRFFLLLNFPLLLAGVTPIPWLLVLLLLIAPGATALLQLALSRTREYDADAQAAYLTGDPEGLARSLQKMERFQGRVLEQILAPGRGVPHPSILRTHPPTDERVRRLLSLQPEPVHPLLQRPELVQEAWPFETTVRPPRRHVFGVWY